MKKQAAGFIIPAAIFCLTFLGCEGMATLLHGEKPEPPPVIYTVTFDANGADGIAPEPQTVVKGGTVRLPNEGSMTKSGYKFGGWNESPGGSGKPYSVGDSVTVAGDMVFFAQWLAPGDLSAAVITVTGIYIYNGSPQIPSYTVTYDSKTLFPGTDFIESISGNVDAGTATITVTATANSNYTGTKTGSFTINKADPEITEWPSAAAITYGAALSTSSLTGGSAMFNGTPLPGLFAWTNGAVIPVFGNSGYEVQFTPNDTANYNTVTKDNVPITVSKATLIVAANDFDIAHNAPVPVYTWTVSNFHQGENTEVLSGTPVLNCAYYQGAPSGNYPIIITQGTLAAANYTFSFENGTVSVGLMAQAALSIVNPGAKTYGNASFSLSTTGGSGTGAVHFEITSDGGSSDVINLTSGGQVAIIGAGSVTVKAVKAGDANYNHAETVPFIITVGKRSLNYAELSVSGTYIYTGSAHTPAPVVTDMIDGVNMINTADYTVSHSNNVNAGTATVTITATANGNYTGSKNADFIILQTVSPDRIEYYWVDQHGSLVTTSGGATTITPGAILTITAQSMGYAVKQWYLNGIDTGQSGNTYRFSSTITGRHTIDLFLEKDGSLYSTTITITVQ